MTPRLLRSLSAPGAGTAAIAATFVLLVALDLARPYAGAGLRPWQWAAGLLAVGVLAGVLRAREGGLRPRWPVLALAALLVPTYVDHNRRIEIGDPVHYYSSLRSVLFDGDVRLANDYELLGWGGHQSENAQPIGAPLLWSPFVLVVHVGRAGRTPLRPARSGRNRAASTPPRSPWRPSATGWPGCSSSWPPCGASSPRPPPSGRPSCAGWARRCAST